jgi:hypothetical protein
MQPSVLMGGEPLCQHSFSNSKDVEKNLSSVLECGLSMFDTDLHTSNSASIGLFDAIIIALCCYSLDIPLRSVI